MQHNSDHDCFMCCKFSMVKKAMVLRAKVKALVGIPKSLCWPSPTHYSLLFRSQEPCCSSRAYDQLWPRRTCFPVLSPQSLISDTPVPLLFLLLWQSTWPKQLTEGWVHLSRSLLWQGGHDSRGLGWLVLAPAVSQQRELTAVTLLAFSSFLFIFSLEP